MATTYHNGYTTQTTVLEDFKIACCFGNYAVRDTFNNLIRDFGDDWVYLAEMNLALNNLGWYFYERHNSLSDVCFGLYEDVATHAEDVLSGEDLSNYYQAID